MNWEMMQTTAKGGLVKYLGKLGLSVLGMLCSLLIQMRGVFLGLQKTVVCLYCLVSHLLALMIMVLTLMIMVISSMRNTYAFGENYFYFEEAELSLIHI